MNSPFLPPVFIALGSNRGRSHEIVQEAIARLQARSLRPLACSSLWQSSPVDCPPGTPPFVNAVVGLWPHNEESPESLLDGLQSLEKEFGRLPKKEQNEPRPLDLDLIVFGGEVRISARLTLPHPRAHRRRFVLLPLCEIAPELILPGQSRSARQLLDQLASNEELARLEPADNSRISDRPL